MSNSAPKKPATPAKKARKEVDGDEIFKAPTILREPMSKQVRLGGKILIRVTATGLPLPSYQWYFNGIKIAGATSDRYMVNKCRRQHAGAYTCEVKNFVGKLMSRAAMISFFTEKTVPDVEVNPKAATVQAGKAFRFEITAPEAEALAKFKFMWVFNGKRINGATNKLLEFLEVKKKYEGEYKVIVIAGSEIRSSNIVKLKVVEKDVPPPEEKEEEKACQAETPEEAPAPPEDFFFDPEEDGDGAPAEEAPAAPEEDGFFTPDPVDAPQEAKVIPLTFPPKAASDDGTITKLCRKKEALERILEGLKTPKKAA